MKRNSYLSPVVRVVCLTIMIALTTPLLAQPRISLGPEVVVGPIESTTLPPSDSARSGATALWNGTEWIVAFYDRRAASGTWIQRIASDGTILLSPNRRLTKERPTDLVRFGSGYLLGTSDGVVTLDHELLPVERIGNGSFSIAASTDRALVFSPDLRNLRLLEPGSEVEIDSGTLLSGHPVYRSAGVAASDSNWILAWEDEKTPGLLLYNLIDAAGNIVFDEPLELTRSAAYSRIASGWDGSRYVVAWHTYEFNEPNTFTIVTIDLSGGIQSRQTVVTTDLQSLGHLDLDRTGPGEMLLHWRESSGPTRGLFIANGAPSADYQIIVTEPSEIDSDGSGRLFSTHLTTTSARILRASPREVRALTGLLPLRRGSPDRIGLITTDSQAVALWSTYEYPRQLVLGSFDADRSNLVDVRNVGSSDRYTMASSGGRHLIVWSEPGESTTLTFPLFARVVDSNRDPLTGDVLIGQSFGDLAAVAHGSGWLVAVARSYPSGLELIRLDPEAKPIGQAINIETLPPQPERSPQTSRPSLIRIDDDKALLAWQEGDFYIQCRFASCPLPPTKGIVRTLIVREGVPDPGTGDVFEEEYPIAYPEITGGDGGTLLLTWVRQYTQEALGPQIVGHLVDFSGAAIGTAFPISSLVSLSQSYGRHATAVAGISNGFIVAWTGSLENVAFGTEVRTAFVSATGSVGAVQAIGNAPHPDILDLARTGDRTATIYYAAPGMEDAGGTYQIFRRDIRVEVDPRRRSIRRR